MLIGDLSHHMHCNGNCFQKLFDKTHRQTEVMCKDTCPLATSGLILKNNQLMQNRMI